MRCSDFTRWLDEGRPDGERALMEEHRAACAPCACEFDAAMMVESALAVVAHPVVKQDFNDAVFRKIHATSPLIAIAAEPIVPVSLALAIVIAWKREFLSAVAMEIADYAVRAAHVPAGSLMIAASGAISLLFAGISWRIFRQFSIPSR